MCSNNTDSCCFIGERRLKNFGIGSVLRTNIVKLIEKGYTNFYVCLGGEYDMIAHNAVINMKKLYPNIQITMVLTEGQTLKDNKMYDNVICLQQKYLDPNNAIRNRTRFLLNKCSYVLMYDPSKRGKISSYARNYAKQCYTTIQKIA